MEKELRLALPKGLFIGIPVSRSRAMRRIKGRNNRSTEVPLRMALVRAGLSGWKMHYRPLAGRPDFFLNKIIS